MMDEVSALTSNHTPCWNEIALGVSRLAAQVLLACQVPHMNSSVNDHTLVDMKLLLAFADLQHKYRLLAKPHI